MLKVYRLVGPDGVGFYFSQGTTLEDKISEDVGYDISLSKAQHPLPRDDGIDSFPDNYYFGFGDKLQLKNWFTPDALKSADKHGCVVELWEVSPHKVIHGGKQLCFNKAESKLITKFQPKSFVKAG